MYQGSMTFAEWCKQYGGGACAIWISGQYIAICYDTSVRVERRADHSMIETNEHYREDDLAALAHLIGDEMGECYDHGAYFN